MYQFTKLIGSILCIYAVELVQSTYVNDGQPFLCTRAEITQVRIENCKSEPCLIKKGVSLPVELDFSFETPPKTDEINFSVFIPYWNKPGTGSFGSYLVRANECSKLNLNGTCPAVANTKYTLKSSIYIDPESKDSLNGEKTGKRRTSWSLTPTLRLPGGNSYSSCLFLVEFEITE